LKRREFEVYQDGMIVFVGDAYKVRKWVEEQLEAVFGFSLRN
jgi:hypothetical protein